MCDLYFYGQGNFQVEDRRHYVWQQDVFVLEAVSFNNTEPDFSVCDVKLVSFSDIIKTYSGDTIAIISPTQPSINLTDTCNIE